MFEAHPTSTSTDIEPAVLGTHVATRPRKPDLLRGDFIAARTTSRVANRWCKVSTVLNVRGARAFAGNRERRFASIVNALRTRMLLVARNRREVQELALRARLSFLLLGV